MSANPTSVAISDLLAIKPRNGLYKSKEHHGSGHRWIKMSEVYGNDFLTGQETERLEVTPTEINKFGCLEGDLLFGRTSLTLEGVGDCLLVGDVNDQPIFESNLFRIRLDRSKALPLFYFYFFKSKAGKLLIQTIAKQTAATSITSTDFINLRVPYPKLDIQRKIAVQIHSFDKKICLNNQINQTLEQMAQAIFKSWFVDFEPVRAKIAALEAGGSAQDALLAAMKAISGKDEAALARLKAEQPEQYAELQATAALFPSAMQDSELGEIPEGWETGKLSQLLLFNPSRTLKKGTEAPYLDMKNVPTSGHLAEEVIIREMASGTKFVNGDTLLARITPCLENGKTAYVDFLKQDQVGWGSTEYIVMRPQEGYPESLGYFIARNAHFRQCAIQSMTGTSGRQRANAKALAEQPWVIYPGEIAMAFDKIASAYLKLAKRHGDESKSLAQLRDTLLPKLLSGELSLEDIETGEVATA